MPKEPIILWFRQDLRLEDNPALAAALALERPIIPIYIWAPGEEAAWPPGSASRWWLHHSLRALGAELQRRGSCLVIQSGDSLSILEQQIESSGACGVFWNRRYEPAAILRDGNIKTHLRGRGLQAESFNSALLIEPHQITTKVGGPFQVFTPFWKACLGHMEVPPEFLPPRRLPAPPDWPASLDLQSLQLLPRIDWAAGLRAAWQPGESRAQELLERFLQHGAPNYKLGRDFPGESHTSHLSPHLHFGEIGPRQVWRAASERGELEHRAGYAQNAEHFLREVGWREFAYHLLYHFPHTTQKPLRPEFEKFPWRQADRALRAWQRGRTGYPLVDAGMRELWHTGWMHNRIRMVAASFLVKHLLIPWQSGAAWFWDTLVDADLASNTLGWQWTAGCGADAAPYFRIFNPITQGLKFDPEGKYIRQWVPEIAKLETRALHAPWQENALTLAEAGITPCQHYPEPIVDHAAARERALAALATLKS